MINRRRLVGAVASGALAEPFWAHPQPKVWRVGYIGIAPAGKSPEGDRLLGSFLQALRDSGFVEGKNMVFDRRATGGQADRAAALAAELVGLHVDVIVTINNESAVAAKAATTTIPIVFMGVSDAVASGLAVSLSRPGGNVTGLSDFSLDLRSKRLELLKAVAPKAVRVAFLQDDEAGFYGAVKGRAERKELDAASKALGISLVRIVMHSPQDFQEASAAILREHVDAILASADPIFSVQKELGDFAIQQRLPSVVSNRSTLVGGALMSYGADYYDIFRKAGTCVAKILDGANPADLPIEQPTKVEFVINLKTANAIGLTIPPSLLLRADEVIR